MQSARDSGIPEQKHKWQIVVNFDMAFLQAHYQAGQKWYFSRETIYRSREIST